MDVYLKKDFIKKLKAEKNGLNIEVPKITIIGKKWKIELEDGTQKIVDEKEVYFDDGKSYCYINKGKNNENKN